MAAEDPVMADHPFCSSLDMQRTFFLNVIRCFAPEHAGFAPQPGMLTVAGQIAHTALTVDWFFVGAFRPEGFDMDFPAHLAAARAVTTLDQAIATFNASYDAGIARLGEVSMAELHLPIAPGPIMGGAPRIAIIEGLCDHTAHHRGALAVYARLLGLSPPMPYVG
jgi:uncharacterized damage-inducible protein DinB